jgi:hypothetical protein
VLRRGVVQATPEKGLPTEAAWFRSCLSECWDCQTARVDAKWLHLVGYHLRETEDNKGIQ